MKLSKRYIFVIFVVLLLQLDTFCIAERNTTSPFSKKSATNFNQHNSTNEIAFLNPVNKDTYKLGPGDQVSIHIIVGNNSLNVDHDFTVNSDGTIFLPHLNSIMLDGLTILEAEQKLKNIITQKYSKHFTLSFLLKKPRLVKVYITGQVEDPGIHSVVATSRISEAIKYAGGILPGGSKRNIIFRRDDQELFIDLENIFKKGEIAKDIMLEAGDILHVPIAKKTITILGEINHPGVYEIKPDEKLFDILMLAGYLKNSSSLSNIIYLKRKKGTDDFDTYKLNFHNLLNNSENNTNNVSLKAGDIITIPEIKFHVYVQGEVASPGRFDYIPGKKLSDYLNLAGGVLNNANVSNINIARQINQKTKMLKVDGYRILRLGETQYDVEIVGGDVINVPGNFFYIKDLFSLSTFILTLDSLYNVFSGK